MQYCCRIFIRIALKLFRSLVSGNLLVLAVYTVIGLAIFWPVFFGKVNLNGNYLVSFYNFYGQNLPFKDTGHDQLRIYFPFYKVTLDAIKDFRVPLWNPYAFSGHPHFADFQTAVFYPLNVFGIFLSQIAFWHFLRITPAIFAAFFTYLYLRNLKLSQVSSFFGGLVFGFSPFIITWGEEVVMSPHSIIFLPLTLLAIDKLFEKFSRLFFLSLALSVTFSIFAGYLQTTIYMLIFVSVYGAFRFFNQKVPIRRAFWAVFAVILGILISAVQLLPSVELFYASARSGIDFTEVIKGYLIPPSVLLSYLAPDFFGNPATRNYFFSGLHYYESILFIGIAPVMFSLFLLFRKRDKLTIFLAVWVFVSLMTVIDSPFSRFFISLPLPFISTAIPNRILFIPAFCFAAMGALGLDLWLKDKKESLLKAVFLIGGVYFLVILYPVLVKFSIWPFGQEVFDEKKLVNLRNLVIPVGIFSVVSFITLLFRNRKLAVYLIVLATAFNIYYFSSKYLVFSDRKYVFPVTPTIRFLTENQGLYRTLFAGRNIFGTNLASLYGVFYPEGYDSLNNKNYSQFVHKFRGVEELGVALKRSDADLGFENLQESFSNPEKLKLLNLLGIRYIVVSGDDRKVLSEHQFNEVFAEGDLSVFENTQALPKAFLVSRGVGAESMDEAISKIRDSNFDLTRLVTLPRDVSFGDGEGNAGVTEYSLNEVIIETSSVEPKILVLGESFYPGWKAEVDGKKAEVMRGNYIFRAVEVDGGKHEVRFYLDNFPFKLGALITILGIALLGFILRLRIEV